ncbi:hypothetical protein RSSM_04122 [Rhodopirellula sallentina SM41]|uniref:Uncharacterized protein n=1 Tax=Rhodopirellula sallentina SM41 TaxID=1263870 RepID=M5U978_9BACT|nr:hypothetical protein RSSM_04122 [Rhodopirellula sallentina SM41]
MSATYSTRSLVRSQPVSNPVRSPQHCMLALGLSIKTRHRTAKDHPGSLQPGHASESERSCLPLRKNFVFPLASTASSGIAC